MHQGDSGSKAERTPDTVTQNHHFESGRTLIGSLNLSNPNVYHHHSLSTKGPKKLYFKLTI
uniref:Uncharacterized protein n=1 Tax=Anguilla anguilla TaxID=7936 RepID=A0A0E9TRW3_ANGAN